MSKINNTTAYVPTAPTATTILIGSEDSAGATRNYLVSDLATYMSTNLTNLTLTGFLTVGGATTLSSTLDVTSATQLNSSLTVEGITTFNDGVTATSSFGVLGTASLANTTVSGLPKLTGLSTFADNAAALGGGLVADDVYKTATGELRIVV